VNFTLSRTQQADHRRRADRGSWLLFALYTWSALTWTYSSGERAGYVQEVLEEGLDL